MKERFAISGSNGFLGKDLTRYLGKENVISMDRLPQRVEADVYFDLASFGNLSHQTNYAEMYRANTWRVINQLQAIEDLDYDAYVYVSSSSVTLPHQTYYSASKKATEQFLEVYARETNKPVVVVRPYSITGVGEQEQHLIPKLIHSCFTGEEIPFVGEPVHDFLDVEDFTRALLLISQNAKNYKGYVFPVGSGKMYTNEQVLQLVEKATQRKANIKRVESMRAYDTKEWMADGTLMYSLGWQPTKTLEGSIKDMVSAYPL